MAAVDLARIFSGVQSPVDRLQSGIKFGQEQSDRQALLEAQQAQAEKTKLLNDELAAISKDPTSEALRGFSIRNPAFAANLIKPIEQLDAETKKNTVTEMLNIYSASASGNDDAVISLLERKKQAAINSGDKQSEAAATVALETAKNNPKSLQTVLGLQLSGIMGDDFTAIQESLQEQATARTMDPVKLKQALADLGKTKAKTDKILKETAANAKAGYTNVSPARAQALGLPAGGVYQEGPDGKIFTVVDAPEAGGPKPLTELAKLNQDRAAGKITQEQFDLKVQKTLGLSGETAFKAAGVIQASEALPELKKLLFKDGDLREANLVFDPSVPFTEETKNLNTLFRSAAWAMLRGESGAVINQSEVDEAYLTYFPTVFDTDASARLKFEQFEKRISGARTLLLPELEGKTGPNVDAILNTRFDKEGNPIG